MRLKKLAKRATAATMATFIVIGGSYNSHLPYAFAKEIDLSTSTEKKIETSVEELIPKAQEATTELLDTEILESTETESPVRSTVVAFSQTESVLQSYDDKGFHYEEKKSSNGEFTITAKEDITDSNGKKLYTAGDVVSVIKSDATGSVSTSLPDGTYDVITTAGKGMKSQTESFEIRHDKEANKTIFIVKGQQKSVFAIDFPSGRNKAVIENTMGVGIEVTDAESDEGIYGVTYTLCAADDIYNGDGTKILNSMDIIQTATTGEDGRIVFSVDLPEQSAKNTGHYMLQIKDTPQGYFSNNNTVDLYLLGEGVDKGIELSSKQSLTQTKVSFVLNNENEDALAGGTFTVTDNKGNIVDTFSSMADMNNIKGLALTEKNLVDAKGFSLEGANVYTISQVSAASGYAKTNKRIKFFLTEEHMTGDLNRAVIHYSELEDTLLFSQIIKGQGNYSDESGYVPSTKETNNAILWGVHNEVLYVFVSDTATQADVNKFITSDFYKLSHGAEFSKVFVSDNGKDLSQFYKDIRTTSKPVNMEVSSDYSEIIIKDTRSDNFKTMGAEDGTLMMKSQKTSMMFPVIDIKNGLPISGAQIQLLNEDGGIIEVFTTEEKSHLVTGLGAGKYKVHVISVPESKGYVLPDDIIFTVNETTTTQVVPIAVDYTKLQFSVLDEATKAAVAGAELQLLDAVGNVVKTWESSSVPTRFEYIAPGTYTVKEVKASFEKGYITNQVPVSIMIKSTHEEQSYTTADKHTTISIEKLDKLDGAVLSGATLELYNSNDVLVDKWVTGSGVHEISYLPIGNYTLKETASPAGYMVSENQSIEIKDTSEIQKTSSVSTAYPVSFKNQTNKGEAIIGTKMVLTDSNGTVIDSFTSSETDHVISNLKVSGETKVTYRLSVKKAAKGYATSDDITFYVKGKDKDVSIVKKGENSYSDTSSNTYTLVESPTKVRFYKKDVITDKYLKDAALTIYSKDGKKMASWKSKNAYHQIEKLPVGTYVVKENASPKGYSTSKDVTFTIKDTSKSQKVVIYSKPSKSKIKLRLRNAADEIALEGAVFTIYKNGATVGTMTTDKDGYAVSEKLPIGYFGENDTFKGFIQYTVIETSAPKGYFLSGEEHAITIKKGGTTFDIGDISSIRKGKTGSISTMKGTASPAQKTSKENSNKKSDKGKETSIEPYAGVLDTEETSSIKKGKEESMSSTKGADSSSKEVSKEDSNKKPNKEKEVSDKSKTDTKSNAPSYITILFAGIIAVVIYIKKRKRKR